MKISGNEIRVGMLIEHKNDLWQVLKTQHVKPGKGGAFAQFKIFMFALYLTFLVFVEKKAPKAM